MSASETSSAHDRTLERARRIALEAVLAALIVASGRFKLLPNVEWVSLFCLTAGLLLGPLAGIRVAAVGEFLYSLLSPYGLAPPLVLLAQIVGMAPAGAAGGFLRRRKHPFWVYGAVAIVTTLWFDLWTNLASAPYAGGVRRALLLALPFSAIHKLSNVVLFSLAGPILHARLSPHFSSSPRR